MNVVTAIDANNKKVENEVTLAKTQDYQINVHKSAYWNTAQETVNEREKTRALSTISQIQRQRNYSLLEMKIVNNN
jgi:hypothetical protein